MKLTKNFKLEEFTTSAVNDYQLSLIKILANELQSLRDYINGDNNLKKDKRKAIAMTVVSGVRTQSDYNRLVKAGYNPSKTSDHFYGLQTNATPTIGAADIQFSNLGVSYEDLFKKVCQLCEYSNVYFGQIILEHNPKKKKTWWIHFGNDPKLIFSDDVAQSIKRTKYLISLDNGKTYKEHKV